MPERNSGGEIIGWQSASWGCSDHENVLRQIEAAHALERKYPWYRIAMHPWHARKIIEDGDLAVILAIETDKPLSDDDGTYGNWRDQLDEYRSLGVTTMQVVHELNSLFCGAAPHRGIMEWLQRVQWPIDSLSNLVRGSWGFNTDANGHNVKPFPREGEQLVDAWSPATCRSTSPTAARSAGTRSRTGSRRATASTTCTRSSSVCSDPAAGSGISVPTSSTGRRSS